MAQQMHKTRDDVEVDRRPVLRKFWALTNWLLTMRKCMVSRALNFEQRDPIPCRHNRPTDREKGRGRRRSADSYLGQGRKDKSKYLKAGREDNLMSPFECNVGVYFTSCVERRLTLGTKKISFCWCAFGEQTLTLFGVAAQTPSPVMWDNLPARKLRKKKELLEGRIGVDCRLGVAGEGELTDPTDPSVPGGPAWSFSISPCSIPSHRRLGMLATCTISMCGRCSYKKC